MPAEPHIDLTVLIVSYETRDLTLACLEAAERACDRARDRGLSCRILVVDNASTDGSAAAIRERFPELQLLALDENIGFARANNLAAKEAAKTKRERYLLLLNPDTVATRTAFVELVTFADARPEAGIFGGRTTFPDGSLNRASCWGRPTPWSTFCLGSGLAALFRGSSFFDPESLGAWARNTERQVDIVSGCLLLIRRELWDTLGGFDEEFFMYGEDADLCLRAALRGAPCRVTPLAEIVHIGGASEAVRANKMVSLFRARARLYRKHWSPRSANFGVRMLDLWAFTRMAAFAVLRAVRAKWRTSFEAWSEVWRRRGEWGVSAEDA